MSPLGGVAVATRPQHGDINNESEGTGSIDDHGRGSRSEELTLVQAGELMGVCYRQSKRVWRRYQAEGDAGWCIGCAASPARGASRRRCGRRCWRVMREERYADFGPTLMAEHLAKERLVVDHETLRRWRLADGQRTVRRRKQKHRQWRERKPCFGAMVQLDGSHHDWFEGRRASAC